MLNNFQANSAWPFFLGRRSEYWQKLGHRHTALSSRVNWCLAEG